MAALDDLISRFDQHAGSAKKLADKHLRPSAEFWYGTSLAFRMARNNLRRTEPNAEAFRQLANTWEALALDARMEASNHDRRATPNKRAYYLGVAEGLENAAAVLHDYIAEMRSRSKGNGARP
jgi:hypothetical protein